MSASTPGDGTSTATIAARGKTIDAAEKATLEQQAAEAQRRTAEETAAKTEAQKKMQEAQAAISALHGKDSDGRALTVNEAKPRTQSGGNGADGTGSSTGGDRVAAHRGTVVDKLRRRG